jgi:hypothetical protein
MRPMAMQRVSPTSRTVRCIRWLARPLAIVSIWLVAVGFFWTAYTVAGKRDPRSFEVLVFTAAFATAAVLSASMALLLGGKRRWAMETALSVLTVIGNLIGGACALFWLVPSAGQYLLGLRVPDFLAFRGEFLWSALMIAKVAVPTGAVLGLMIGVIAGLLLALAGRRPRLVGWLVAGLLLACVMGSIHVVAFDRLTGLVANIRLNGVSQLEYAWFLTGELVSAMGATAGAVVGAVISCGAVRMEVRSRRNIPPGRDSRIDS